MKRIACFALLLFSFTSARAGMFSYMPFERGQWTQSTVITSENKTSEMTQKVYFKKGKMRVEGIVEAPGDGEAREYVSIITDKDFITYDPRSKQGMKYAVKTKDNPQQAEADFDRCRESADKKGTETLNGIKCAVYEYACKTNGTQYRVKQWVSDDDSFPLKTVYESGKTRTVSLVTGLNTTAPVNDALFTPGKDIKIMDMGAAGAAMEEQARQEDADETAGGGDELGESEEDQEAAREAAKEMMRQMMGK